MSNQQRRTPRTPIPRYTAPSSPFLSHQTITFLASWRGQLLVCTVVLILGALYFFIRPSIDQWHIKRKEALSRKRELELMRMSEREKKQNNMEEKDEVGLIKNNGGSVKDKNRDGNKKKEGGGRKRLNSHLRPLPLSDTSNTTTGGSSLESSPGPSKNLSPSPPKANLLPSPSKSKRSNSNSKFTNTTTSSIKLQKALEKPSAQSMTTPSRNKPPPPIIVPKPSISLLPPVDPWNIPLPASPMAGPSRLTAPSNGVNGLSMEEISDDASASASALSINEGSIEGREQPEETKKKFEGFSIYPEEGYLPQQSSSINKKRKKKTKLPNGIPNNPPSNDSPSTKSPIPPNVELDEISEIIPSRPNRKHKHTRTSSITLLPNLGVSELREIVEKRDETIDQLRAEIGMAKAEESKAKEESVRSRMDQEKLRTEMERARRGRGVEGGDRRREAELQSSLSQMQQLYTTALARLSICESALRDSGIILPPLPSPIPMHLPQSPLPPMPSSPYAPSPGLGRHTPIMGGGFLSYPSPGMYPSPMLHPNLHYPHNHGHHSPSPYRRTSSMNNGHGNGFPNGLSPGIMVGNGNVMNNEEMHGFSYPMDIGSSTMPIGLGHPINSNGEREGEREKRRQSIESSVLKKKIQPMSTAEVSSGNGSETQVNGESCNGEVIRNGNGSNETSSSNQDEESSSISIESSSISPRSRSKSPSNGSSLDNGIKVMLDKERGNVYYHSGVDIIENSINDDGEEEGDGEISSSSSQNIDHQIQNVLKSNDENDEIEEDDIKDKPEFQPIFASLAHTPEQIEELRQSQIRINSGNINKTDKQRDRGRSISISSSSSTGKNGNNRGMTAGLGNGGLLTPSPSKSPIPLRG